MDDFKVLLVDDEEEFLRSLSERLELRDLKPGTATSGEQALERIEDEEHTVIVLDLKMPGMDGLEVLKKLKNLHPTIQVVILTGHGSEKDREAAEKLGAFAYLHKPVHMDTLMDTLRRAHKKFRSIKHSVDTALMASAMAQAGEVDTARKMMAEELGDTDEDEDEK